MKFSDLHRVFFIGIGGIGMSAIARYFKLNGIEVFGYDKTQTALTDALISEGMIINFEDDVKNIPDNIDLVVYTPAIPSNHKELSYFIEKGFEVKKRSEVLEEISKNHFTIAISGSHGKTTVSSMIAHILKASGYGCTAFIGGILTNYNTNFIYEKGEDVFVIEADEFDRSFHRLNPDLAVITAIDSDHLDIYGSKENIDIAYKEFADKLKPNGKLIIQKDVSIVKNLENKVVETYSIEETDSDYSVTGYKQNEGFILRFTNAEIPFKLNVPGIHNIENAVAAIAVCLSIGLPADTIREALKTFKGIKRRFEYIINNGRIVLIDDYAHHPEEIKQLLLSVKGLYPEKNIKVVFQPHLFSRTKDLAAEFGKSLSLADEVILLPIYPAREKPIEGVSSKLILNHVSSKIKQIIEKQDLISVLESEHSEVVLTVGAGDIDKLVNPIKDSLVKKYRLVVKA